MPKAIYKKIKGSLCGIFAAFVLTPTVAQAIDAPNNYRNETITKRVNSQTLTKPSSKKSPIINGISPFIIGGNDAAISDWPYIAALVQIGGVHFCGGSLIRPDVVMTAAHCVDGLSVSSFGVAFGTGIKSEFGIAGEFIEVEEIVIHESYDPFTLENDIALIYLDTPSIQPVVELIEPSQFDNLELGSSLTVAGWGWIEPGESITPEILQQIDVEYTDSQICRDGYAKTSVPNIVTDTMICAGTPAGGQDVCKGDSGGPLVLFEDGAPKQVGIVSWGDLPCAQEGLYGVYTKVAEYNAWITQQLSNLIEDSAIADPALRMCVTEEALATGAIETGEIVKLNCDGFGISELDGIQAFEQLKTLSLSDNQISDISPLKSLNQLEMLNLASNPEISNVSALFYIEQLSSIELFGTNVTCIDTGSPVTAQELFDACASPIELMVFEDVMLRECVLREADLRDWTAIDEVTELSCDSLGIQSISGIEEFSELNTLILAINQITDISAMNALTNLSVLNLQFNKIEDISPLSNLINLSELILWGNMISDITPVQNLIDLITLDLDTNQITDITALENLVNLETLWLINNPIECFEPSGSITYSDIPLNCFGDFELHPLAELVFDPQLRQCVSNAAISNGWNTPEDVTALFCAFEGINDIFGLENFSNLQELDLFSNNIFDIRPLFELLELRFLVLGENDISDISPLANLTSLELLVLESNPIFDIFPLAGLTNLQNISLLNVPEVTCIDGDNGLFNYETLAEACFNIEPFETLVDDPALDQCIQRDAQFMGWQTIEDVSAINCISAGVNSLEGLENYTSLGELIVANNSIDDLSPISNLPNLGVIDIADNNVDSLESLEGMVQIFFLIISGNPIECTDQGIFFSYFEIPPTCFSPEPPAEQDTDGDGIVDSLDNCPTKPNKNQKDTDKDGLGNKCDADDDNDGFTDAEENRAGSDPRNPNSTPDSIVFDADSDGILDFLDNCPNKANANQKDYDFDGQGNACDVDDDNDGFTDAEENNAGSNSKDPNSTPITVIIDWDNDGILDTQDNCPLVANANQKDSDRDGLGNKCDSDNDNDSYTDAEENNAGSDPRNPNSTPETLVFDADSDTIPNAWDNCINTPNSNQKDTDQDGLGNACDADDDNDGFTDIEENIAGTNPQNPASFPVI